MDELERAVMTVGCRDCDSIPKIPGAGQIHIENNRSIQLMHNGVRVLAGGYHGDWMAQIIRGLQGHHEPQEELLFHHLLRYVRHNSLMVELGAFWAYYTLWYLHEIPGAQAICVEPDPANIRIGIANATLNHALERIRFTEAWVGSEHHQLHTAMCDSTREPRTLPSLNMETVLELAGGRSVEMLHLDAQGAELLFIRSIRSDVIRGRLRFLVVSTHHSSISESPSTHTDCLATLDRLGAVILSEHSVQESFSGDGLIVASFADADRRIRLPDISRNQPSMSMFPTM